MTLSVIIPVRNSSGSLRRCLQAVLASSYVDYECIVVDDSSTDDTVAMAREFPVRLIVLSDGPYGPGYARNRGAEVAQGDILLFVDSDVLITPDTIGQVVETMASRPRFAAVFGSYDDSPDGQGFLSQYKNLFHHFVHQQAIGEAATFWAGCGAVRRDVFLALGGFDVQHYSRPCIEDIEFGYRLRAAGHEIALNKQIQVKHLKRWTLWGIIRSDTIDRGIPWTQLILQRRVLPNNLNLHVSQRVSALLASLLVALLVFVTVHEGMIRLPLLIALFGLMVAKWSSQPPHYQLEGAAGAASALLTGGLAIATVAAGEIGMLPAIGLFPGGVLAGRVLPSHGSVSASISLGAVVLGFAIVLAQLLSRAGWSVAAGSLVLLLALLALNYRFYRFFVRKRGLPFAAAIVPFHLVYFVYSMAAFAVGFGLHTLRGLPVAARRYRHAR